METLTLNALLAGFGRMSLEAGVLVVLVLLAQGLFRRQLTPRWRCALWLLVVARLLLPVSFTSAASLFNLLPAWTNHAAARSAPVIVAVAASPVATAAPAQVAATTAPTRPPPSQTVQVHGNAEADPAFPSSAVSQPPQPPRADAGPAARPSAISWVAVLFGAWLAGALALAAHVGFTSVRLARRIAKLAPIHDPAVRAVLDECRGLVGVATPLEVVATDQVAGPALHGLWRPRLLLPRRCLADFSPGELRFIFLHELAHLKRRDLPLNWLVALLQVAHWFNPLLWLGFARWRADRELACDALALEAAGAGQNRDYGRTILRLLEGFTQRAAAPGLVGILEDKRQMRRRIQMIATFQPGRRWGWLSMLLLAGLGLVCLTDAQAPKVKDAPPVAKADHATTIPARGDEVREVRRGADPAPTEHGTNLPSRTLIVKVVDAATGKPLPGADVFSPYLDRWGTAPPQRLTDEQGRYVLEVPLPPENHRREMDMFSISAERPDFASRSVAWTSSSGNVEAMLPKETTIKLEPGIQIGGVVRDEHGAPLAGVRVLLSGSGYRGFTMGTGEQKTHEYPEIRRRDKAHPAAVTDGAGRWTFAHFPSDLEVLEITLVRPDDSQTEFRTAPGVFNVNQFPLVHLTDLRATNAVFTLPDGVTVRGMVVDEAGRPLANATVEEGYGFGNIVRVSEFKTGADGRFERLHRVPRQWIYTASADGCATVSVIAQVEQTMPEVRLVLPPAKPLRIRVVDEAGQPLAGADLRIDTYRTEGQILNWSAKTDAEGRAVWTNAPLTPVTFYAGSRSLGAQRKFKAAGGEPEKRVVLSNAMSEMITVRVKARDSVSQQPVRVRTVSAIFEGPSSAPRKLAEPNASEFSIEIQQTDFRVGMYPSYKLNLEAGGYESLTTDFIDFDEGDQDLELAMAPGANPPGVALLPDGQPAVGARVWLCAGEDGGAVFCNMPGRYYANHLAQAEVGAEGKFTLPSVAGDPPVVFTHADGLLETTLAEVKRHPEVRLQSWGRVEGILKIAGQPKEGARVSLTTLLWSPATGFQLHYSTTTGPDGRFLFTNVPAGEYKLYWQVGSTESGRLITESYQMPITVKAGETLKVTYASEGRAVIGQAQADPPDAPVDWLNDDHVLVLKQPPLPEVNTEDFATTEAFQKARIASYASPARLQQARDARTYQLEFQSDGSFRADDVPPGQYELRIRVTKPGKNRQFSPYPRPEDELGSLEREVVVLPGSGPFDLGTLTVPIKAEAGTPRTAPLELSAQTLDGQPVSLAQFKGKHVLVVFWAAWSERSLDALAELQKLQTRLAQDGRLALLGVNVGDETAKARKVIEAGGYHWTQARLTDAERAKVTAAFDVNTLPAVLLLDPSGRIVGRDLEGERLQTAVRRALSKR